MTCEDANTKEMKELDDLATKNKLVKTESDDLEKNLKIFGMIMNALSMMGEGDGD